MNKEASRVVGGRTYERFGCTLLIFSGYPTDLPESQTNSDQDEINYAINTNARITYVFITKYKYSGIFQKPLNLQHSRQQTAVLQIEQGPQAGIQRGKSSSF
ncbi:MAG: hypothetical protein D6742_00785 [Cyanobacteria bacterium J069]|nr:MAG: hypothetical protein D6742_00785 [Cyanobacteria bacterium J069]